MARIVYITKDDTPETIRKKLAELQSSPNPHYKGFEAHKYTGKVKSFGDPIEYQRKLRDEWR